MQVHFPTGINIHKFTQKLISILLGVVLGGWIIWVVDYAITRKNRSITPLRQKNRSITPLRQKKSLNYAITRKKIDELRHRQ